MKTEIIDKDKPHKRAFGTVRWEKRMEGESEEQMPTKFGGIAAVVESETDMYYYDESIARGAFDSALMRSDVDIRVLGNHGDNELLARTKSGTAKVFVNSDGNLEYEWTPDYENPTHMKWARSIMRGDCNQSSFQFTIEEYKYQRAANAEEKDKCIITKVGRIYDVSPVTFPAYEDTVSEARSISNLHRESLQQREMQRDLDLLEILRIKIK